MSICEHGKYTMFCDECQIPIFNEEEEEVYNKSLISTK